MALGRTLKLIRHSAREIRQQEGPAGLLRAALRFLMSPVYKSETFFLIENPPRPEYDPSEARPGVSVDELNFKVVASNQEAEKLEAEGFSFRRHPTYFNFDLQVYTRWLDAGAIAFCTFVGKEFAAINWVIPSLHTQRALKEPPLKVDYHNHEVYPRGAWVNPKYRRMELYRYTLRSRDRFLAANGVTMFRGTVDFTNKAGKGISDANMSRQYGVGRRTRILGWTLWKETYSRPT